MKKTLIALAVSLSLTAPMISSAGGVAVIAMPSAVSGHPSISIQKKSVISVRASDLIKGRLSCRNLKGVERYELTASVKGHVISVRAFCANGMEYPYVP